MSIHPDTKLGHVQLTVQDFKRSLPFYTDALGFKVHENKNGVARLGAGGADLLRLTENPSANEPGRATGLYHFAILVPSRYALAQSLRRLAETETPLQGFSDHLVSEALYLADPDGNGIEIYRDRPRDQWYDARGNFRMASDPLDLRAILNEWEKDPKPWTGLEPGTVLGHMHLKVADVKRDEAFYRDVVGFDEMANLASAAFVSAGGYHHHLGMNIWESRGAPPPKPDSIGLQHFTVRLPNHAELGKVTQRIREAGFPLEETEEGLLVRDPSQNGMVLTL